MLIMLCSNDMFKSDVIMKGEGKVVNVSVF